MTETLQRALDKWNAASSRATDAGTTSKELVQAGSIKPPGDDRYPTGGLVLRCSYRDLPRKHTHEHADKWNEDFAWYTKEQARQFVPASPKVGQRHPVPIEIVGHLARFHLLDRVRGEVDYFRKEDMKSATLITKVTKIRSNLVSVVFTGETHASAEGMWGVDGPHDKSWHKRGFRASLLGHGKYDLRKQEFVRFELIALGSRWGGTEYNLRQDDLEESPMGVALTLAGDDPLERLPPAHLWAYYKEDSKSIQVAQPEVVESQGDKRRKVGSSDSQIEGTWTLVSESSKEAIAPADSVTMRIGDGKWFDSRGANGTYRLGPNKQPTTIDISVSTGQFAGKTMLGIMKLNNDTLTFCFYAHGDSRPTNLSRGFLRQVWKSND